MVTRINAEFVAVDAVEVPSEYGPHRYGPQSFIRFNGRVYSVLGGTVPHESQVREAMLSKRTSQVECELVADKHSAVHTRIVAAHGAYAETNDRDIRKLADAN